MPKGGGKGNPSVSGDRKAPGGGITLDVIRPRSEINFQPYFTSLEMGRTACIAIVLVATTSRADEPADSIQASLDKAVAVYQAEMKSCREKAGTWFAEQEAAARKNGDKKRVDKLKEEARLYRVLGDLPAGAPGDIRKRQSAGRDKLLQVYTAAVKDATKASADKLAARIEKEAALIRGGLDPSLDRRHLVHASGEFWTDGKGIWQEIVPNGQRHTFREVDRTPEYVEITATIGGRPYDARLTNMGAFFRIGGTGEFKMTYPGSWWVWGQPRPKF